MPPATQWYDATKTFQIDSPGAATVVAGNSLTVGDRWVFNDKGSLLGATVMTSPRVGIEAWDGVSWLRSGLPILDDAMFEAAVTGVDKTGDAGMASQTTSYQPMGSGRELGLTTISVGCGRQISLRLVAPLGASEHGRQVRFYVIPAGSPTAVFSGPMTVAGTLVVGGAVTLQSTLAVTGVTTVGGTLGVTGTSTLAALQATKIGIGVAPPGGLTLLHATTSTAGPAILLAATTDNVGANSYAGLEAQANGGSDRTLVIQHGLGSTQSRFGVTMSRFAEVLGGVAGGGLVVGAYGAFPLILGTNQIAGLRFDGTNPHPSFPNSDKRTTATFSKTSDTTLANVTGLTATLTAGKTYRFVAKLPTTSNVAGGVKFAIAGTATATAIWYEALVWDGTALSAHTRAAALATAVGGVTAVTAAFCWIFGTITVNAAGTLTVQFAQNASSGTASTVVIGSLFYVREVA